MATKEAPTVGKNLHVSKRELGEKLHHKSELVIGQLLLRTGRLLLKRAVGFLQRMLGLYL